MTAERWRPIPGFEGLYEVSDAGRVRSCARQFCRVARIMAGTVSGNGYAVVSLRKPGQRQQKRYVHRLVAAAFVGGDGDEVNHIDGAKLNNGWQNLEWCSHTANMAHAWDSGLIRNGRRAA